MKCPDCGSEKLDIVWKKNYLFCPNCKFSSDAVRFLGDIEDFEGKTWTFFYMGSGEYEIRVANHFLAKLLTSDKKKEVSQLSLTVYEPDVAWRLVDFFKKVFGENVLIDVSLQTYDPDTECPICREETEYVRVDPEVFCSKCNHFHMGLYTYLISRLNAEGYKVGSRSLGKFTIETGGLWSVDVAEFEDRAEIFTLRPIGNYLKAFEKLKTLFESLGLCERVVVLLPLE